MDDVGVAGDQRAVALGVERSGAAREFLLGPAAFAGVDLIHEGLVNGDLAGGGVDDFDRGHGIGQRKVHAGAEDLLAGVADDFAEAQHDRGLLFVDGEDAGEKVEHDENDHHRSEQGEADLQRVSERLLGGVERDVILIMVMMMMIVVMVITVVVVVMMAVIVGKGV